MREAGIDPAPDRTASTWADFLRSQADALLACDFLETVTLTGTRMYVLAVIEHASRRIRILGATAHPAAGWVMQAVRNLVMDLEDAGCRARFLIRDRDGKFPALVDAVLADAGIAVVLSGVRMPRMNSIMERWVQTCRRELLDRTLIWNQRHLLHALREFEQFYNGHRPASAADRSSDGARRVLTLDSEEWEQRPLAPDAERRDVIGGADNCAFQRGNTVEAKRRPDSGEVRPRQVDVDRGAFTARTAKVAQLAGCDRPVREVHYDAFHRRILVMLDHSAFNRQC